MIEIKNLKKCYGKKVVFDNLNISIEKNKITALIGLNGSGKSTLLDIISGVKKYDAGTIKLDSDRPIMEILGYVPQSFNLFADLTVRDNIKYVANIYNIDFAQIDVIIEKCHLQEYAQTLACNLSGGYRQLLNLACALVHCPKLLILDEPTSAMDPIFRNQFWDIIASECSKVTILVATHYYEEVSKADNVLLLGNNSQVKEIKLSSVEELFSAYLVRDEK